MNFSEALEELKNRKKLFREGWNGKGLYVTLIPAGSAHYQGYPMQDCLGLKNIAHEMQPGWVPSQSDMLADDWLLLNDN